MKKLFTLLLFLLLVAGNSWAQVTGYSFAQTSGTYSAITGTTSTATGDDGTQTSIPIGFNFTYSGATQTVFSVTTNGAIAFGSSAPGYSNALATATNTVGALWDDNNLASGSIIYSTTGSVGSRVCVIQWTNCAIGGSGSSTNPTASFQIKLYETSNVVQIIYGGTSAALSGTTASIGITGASGNYESVTPGSPATISTTTANDAISSATLFPSGTIYTFTPPPPCVAPLTQPTTPFILTGVSGTSTQISGSFTAASPVPSGYLVVRYPSAAAVTAPSNGTSYTAGNTLGLGTVVSSAAGTTFTATGLTASTIYDFYVYSYNNTSCVGIAYNITSPLYGSQTTNPVQSISSTATGGLWSSTATWVGGVVPSLEDAVIASGAIVTVDQVVTVRDLTVAGTLQWNASSNAMTVSRDLLINSGGSFLPYTTGLTGQTINIGGNFTNNGYANCAVSSTALVFNGSTQNSSMSQVLGGSGTFQGDGTNGIIRSLQFLTLGSSTISTTQNLIVSNTFVHTAGSLNTNGKLTIDNTAQVFGQVLNSQVANVAVTNMGSAYTSPGPVVFGAAVNLWTSGGTATVTNRYFYGNNVYLCTTGGTFGSTPPTGTSSSTFADNTATLLFIGTLGTIGNPFIVGSLTVGTQYFYGGNLYVAVATTAPGTTPPTHTSGVVGSFLYVGTPAQVSVNYDATSQTVRSLNLVNSGSGYISAAPTVVFSLNGGTGGSASATAVLIQSIIGPANSATSKSTVATITGGLNIVSNQAVGGISTTNGGVNYSAAPSVGFPLPTGFLNLIVTEGAGYTSAPTVTLSGGTKLTGGTDPTFTVTMAQGKVVSVICSGGGTLWTVPPTLTLTGGGFSSQATCAFPANCLPTATATITNGTVTGFTVTNAGFGYPSAPTPALVTNGTVVTAATAPSCRIGLYNLTYNYFSPATSNPSVTAGAEMPSRVNILTMGSSTSLATFANVKLSGNLELYASSSALVFPSSTSVGNLLDLNGNTLTYSHPSNTGTTGSLTLGAVANGPIVIKSPGGSAITKNFPFDATFTVATGTGSSITTLTVTKTAAPTGTGAVGTRGYRLQVNSGAVFGTSPTVTLNYNTNDALLSDQQSLFVAQSTATSGPWTVRSATSGTGSLPSTGSRTTATASPGPVTGDEYYAWNSTYVFTPLSYDISTSSNPYSSIMSTGNTYTWSGTSNDDNYTTTVSIPSSTFTYQGQIITGFQVSTNGWMKLVSASSPATTLSNYTNVFGGGAIPNIVAPFWDDLSTNPNSGGVTTLNACTKYQINGAIGSRQIIAEWSNYTVYGAAGPQLNFQVVLNESDNSISINYGLFQGFNGTNNHRYTYSVGLGGLIVNAFPLPGQVLALQYENSSAFSNQFAAYSNVGANGLMSIPSCNTSILFKPGTYGGFSPPVQNPPTNDEYTGAVTIPALTAFPANLCGNFYTSRFATPSAQTVCAGNNDDDVWFKFTANQPVTTVRVYGSGGYVPRVQVLDASLNPLASPICVVGTAGGTSVDAVLNGITVGTLYYVRVYHDGGGTQATATAVVSGGVVSYLNITSPGSGYTSTTTGAYLTAPFRISGGGGTDATGVISLTNGAVTGITIGGGYGYTSTPTVTIEKPNWAHIGEFAIVVYAPAVNDDCSGAIALTGLTNPGCNEGTNSVTSNTQSATPSSEAAACGTPDDDVWYKFTAVNVATNITLSCTGTFDAAFEVWDGGAGAGNCGTKTSLTCVNAVGAGLTESLSGTTVIGHTYFIRVYHAGAGTANAQTFTLCVSSAVPSCIPSPTTPSNNGFVCPGTVLLSWPAETGATGYDVYLDAGAGPATTQVATNQAGTSFTTVALTAGPYSWRVIPINTFGPATGCTDFHFTVNTPPTVGVSPTSASFCPGSTAVPLTASGAVTYAWSPSTGLDVTTGATVNASPSATTVYTVTGTDGAGCTGTATATISVLPVITASAVATPSSVCQGASSILTASASIQSAYCVPHNEGGACITGVTFNTLSSTPVACVSPYYNNNPATGTNTTSVSKGSTYSLTVTSADAIVSVWIDYDANGTFDASEWNQVYTTGTTGTINITIPAGAADAVTGMRVRSRSTGSSNGSGDACTIFYSGSCEDYKITIGSPSGSTSFNYAWSPTTGLSSPTGSPVTASNISSTITYTVTASATGYCPGSGSATITVDPLVCGALTTGGASACTGVQTVVSHASGGGAPFVYSWTEDGNPFGGNTASITASVGTHTYVCNVTDACNNTCSSSLSVTTYGNPVLTISPKEATLCLPGGSPIAITAGGATTYSWSPSTGLDVTTGATVNANPSTTTTYTVTGTANGCTGTEISTITVAPAVTMGAVTATPPSISSGGSSVLSASATANFIYCTPGFSTTQASGDYLNNFSFANVTNNASGDATNDYTYYSSLTANVIADGSTTYNISCEAGGTASLYAQQFAIWIDYNQNGAFETSEFVWSTTTATYSPNVATGTIIIPNTAYNGVTRMRVASRYYTAITSSMSCYISSAYGEFEDYNVSITGGTTAPPASVTYTWSPGTFLNTTSGSPVTASNVTSTITYTVTASAGGCSASGDVTLTVTGASKTLNVKVFLEGPYAGSGAMTTTLNSLLPLTSPYGTGETVGSIPNTDIVDWVLVEPRIADAPENATSATALAGWPKSCFLKSDGSIVALDGTSLPDVGNPTIIPGNYLYVVVRHRNHLSVMSNFGLSLEVNSFVYDFTTAVTQAFGGASGYKELRLGPAGTCGMVDGDADGDLDIGANDFTVWSQNIGLGGYAPTDIDMDADIGANDFTEWSRVIGLTNIGIVPSKAHSDIKYKSQVPK